MLHKCKSDTHFTFFSYFRKLAEFTVKSVSGCLSSCEVHAPNFEDTYYTFTVITVAERFVTASKDIADSVAIHFKFVAVLILSRHVLFLQ
jgi:hypothetical protein